MPPFPSPTATWHSTAYPAISPSRPELSAKGKSVAITGGGTGIGAETARSFAEAGASRIALLGRRTQPLLDTKASIEEKFPGVDVFVASTDVTQKDQVDSAFEKFGDGGKIDVLVSNAAATGPLEAVKDVDVEKFIEGVVINLKGTLLVAQAFLRYAATDAVVIDINSAAAHLNLAAMFTSYNVSKAAVVRLLDSMAFAHPEMSIFHIQPGVVDTDMNRQAGGVEALGYEDHVSLPANFNVWLASPEAKYLKGKFLWSNWDVEELKAQEKEIEATGKYTLGLVGWPFQNADWKPEISGSSWDQYK